MQNYDKNDCPKYLQNFLNHIRIVEGRAERTEKAYYDDLKTFLRYLKIENNDVDENKTPFEDIKINDVPFDYIKDFTLQDAYGYLNWLANERENQSNTRSRKISALKHFYSYLHNKAMVLENNPVENLELPTKKKSLPKFLSLEDAQKLLISIETKHTERDYCIMTLFLNCGMRLSELCGLDINDIDLENKTIRLLGKGNKERIVALNDACVSAINSYLPYRNTTGTTCDALFFSAKKNRISKRRVQEIVENCLKLAGLSNQGLSTHKLRHTAATLMYRNGVDTLVLKEILGHSSLATTEIYTHLSNENIHRAIESNPLANERHEKMKK